MINPQTFDFLKALAENNNRDWFQAHKPGYEKARENVIGFTAELIKLLHKTDPEIDEAMDPKKRVMRIYRDIRFSANKAPYKNNFGISISMPGLPNGGVEYYIHLQPGAAFIAGGSWMPEAGRLKAIRQEIDYNGHSLETIIDEPEFVKLFGDFRKQEQLKTIPQGYSADNKYIALLKLKSFIVMHHVKDDEFFKADSAQKVAGICNKIRPLNVFLRNAIA